MMLTRTRTRPVPKIATRPDPTRPAGIPVARTRSLPVELPLLGRPSGLPPGPDHYIVLVLMNLFSVVENMCCMHHHHNINVPR